MDKTNLKQGVIFWPVGNGDSTTIIIDDDTIIQHDINHLEISKDNDDDRTPILEELIDMLPEKDGKKYLAAFSLSHPDQDHCRGFKELLSDDDVKIGELWFSPRVFDEYKKDLCDDAVAFQEEAMRRVKKTIENKGEVESGDRVKIIGYSDKLKEDKFNNFPEDLLIIPGNDFFDIDGEDKSSSFRSFIHAPFKDDAFSDRNNTSTAMQITLYGNCEEGDEAEDMKMLLLGDLKYPILKKIFDRSDSSNLEWNILLAPHHCSKSAMYHKDSDEKDEVLQQDIIDAIEEASLEKSYIISSSNEIPASNDDGDNPPHAIAKERYEEMDIEEFICTQENVDSDNPDPVIFSLDDDGVSSFEYVDLNKGLNRAINKASGVNKPPVNRITFGLYE